MAMLPPGPYRLLDFGRERRLEQWGDVRLVRPDAWAVGAPALPAADWEAADAVFEGRVGGGRWTTARPLPERWPVDHAGLRFSVGCAPSGHTGLFPEQAQHWSWMLEAFANEPGLSPARAGPGPGFAREILNLFAYTGGASVALAQAGARVTHVDASRPAIGWARENAALNGVTTVRWIHEDARRFVDREHRRGRRYDGLILDPPTFGHGPAGEWRLERDLEALLAAATGLLRPDPAFVLLNVYSGEIAAADLAPLLTWATGLDPSGRDGAVEAGTLSLTAADGRTLPTGVYARRAPTSTRPAARG
jgi:23S rRNA (cytosine1962-C5)-methyltransferase